MAIGVEYGCKFVLEGPDGSKAVFNESSDPNFVGILDPENCSGLDRAEVREDAVDKTEDDGRVQGNNYYGGRPIVLGGTVIASTVISRNEKVDKILAAADAMRADATLTWYPQGGPVTGIELKVRQNQPTRVTKRYVKEFQIALVGNDPFPRSTTTNTSKKTAAASSKTSFPSEVTEEAIGNKAWIGLSNVLASDNVYATVAFTALGQLSFPMQLKNFDFSIIPTDASIIKFQPEVERKASVSASVEDQYLRVYDGGVLKEETNGAVWSTVEETKKYTTFNASIWTPEKLKANAPELKFRAASIKEGTGSVDAVSITVEWIPALTLSIENKGTAPARPIVWLAGPMTNPTIKNSVTGKAVSLTYSLPKEKYIRIDWQTHTVYLYDKSKTKIESIYSAVQFASSTWFSFLPGKTELYLTGASSTEASIEVEWQDTYR